MKLMNIREFEKYLMEEKGFEAYEEFEDALQEAICLQEEDDEKGTLLGEFIFMPGQAPGQTFQLKVQ